MKNTFHSYDLRGIYNDDFNKDDVYKIGFFIPQLLDTKKVVVGRDIRLSSPEIHEYLIKGITDAGADVDDIGLATTPMVYFATAKYGYKAGVQITASHNPAKYNGLKISKENALPVGYDTGLNLLEKMVLTGEIIPAKIKGKVNERDIRKDYIDFQKNISIDFKNLKIGVDCSNGAVNVILKDIWADAPLYINDVPDGNFPCHEPNPLLPENTRQMQEFVKTNKCDIGLVFDGDADRVVFVDDKGRHVPPDLIIAVAGLYFFGEQKRQGFVIQDIRTSKSVGEFLKQFNAETYTWKVGRAHAAPKLRELQGLFGGEYAGHYYFKDFFFSDSGILAASVILHVAGNLKKEGKKFSDLIDQIRKYENSGEINFTVNDKPAAIKRVTEYFINLEKPLKIMDFDGYRIEYADWWFNIRPSNTEPYLRLLLEAKSKDLLNEKLEIITKLINEK